MSSEIAEVDSQLRNNQPLKNEKDPKDKLTEFAFKLDRSLLGLPLATPLQRLIALSIDMILVALLSDTSGELLALFIAVAFYRLGNKNAGAIENPQKGHKRRKALRITGGFILFVLLLDVTPRFFDFFESEPDQQATLVEVDGITFEDGLTSAALGAAAISTLSTSKCETVDCWQEALEPIVSGFATVKINDDKAREAINEFSAETNLTEEQKDELGKTLFEGYQRKKADYLVSLEALEQAKKIDVASTVNEASELSDSTEAAKSYGYSVVNWVKGIINDLGLGFGWAAFYFTASIVMWKGQTPGKKLMGIRVVQLDGSPLSIWDSFGRYGGYGAGIATGLLGFFQIFWDPNRQAIHDKISATVVIKGAVVKNEAAKAAEAFNVAVPQENK